MAGDLPPTAIFLPSAQALNSVQEGSKAQIMNEEPLKILRIDASMRQDGSISRLLADETLSSYMPNFLTRRL